MDVKDLRITLRFTEKEFDQLMKLAKEDEATKTKEGRENLSKYIRKCIFEKPGVFVNTKRELADLRYQLRKLKMQMHYMAICNERITDEQLSEIKLIEATFQKMLVILKEGDADGYHNAQPFETSEEREPSSSFEKCD